MVFEISSKDASQDWLYPMFTIEVVTDSKDKVYDSNEVNVMTYSTGLIHFLQNKKMKQILTIKNLQKIVLTLK